MAVDCSMAYGDLDAVECADAGSGQSVEVFDLRAGAVCVGVIEKFEFLGGHFLCHRGLFADVTNEAMIPFSFCAGDIPGL